MTGQALIVQGDALHLPLPDGSVDLAVTSPPYLWKRKYAIEGTGELGNERNWREYLNNLWTITDEMLRVLKPKGSIFVNLGDTRVAGREPKWLGVPPKSRLLLPERYRVGCQDRYASRGVIVRQVQIWEKANGLPESTNDRTRDSHEDWVHLVKQPRYYSAIDEIREPQQDAARPNGPRSRLDQISPTGKQMENSGGVHHRTFDKAEAYWNPLGKLPGSVWSVPSEPLRLPEHLGVQHYASFPSEWPRRLILGFSPHGICVDCGQGRVPVVEQRRLSEEAERLLTTRTSNNRYSDGARRGGDTRLRREELLSGTERARLSEPATILGYACSCTPFTDHPGTPRRIHAEDQVWTGGQEHTPVNGGRFANHASQVERTGAWREYHLDRWKPPPTRPAVVLDCFGGTGTTAMVARALGRIGVSVDLSHAYGRAARWRVTHDGAKAISRTNLERQGVLL